MYCPPSQNITRDTMLQWRSASCATNTSSAPGSSVSQCPTWSCEDKCDLYEVGPLLAHVFCVALCPLGRRANRARTVRVAPQSACALSLCVRISFLEAFFLRLSLEQDKIICPPYLVYMGRTCESNRKGISSGQVNPRRQLAPN